METKAAASIVQSNWQGAGHWDRLALHNDDGHMQLANLLLHGYWAAIVH
jgi:hypothetical protein